MPQTCRQLAVCGISAMPVFRGCTRWKKIAICLPKNSPAAIPSGIGVIMQPKVNPASNTPALAKAKIGRTPK